MKVDKNILYSNIKLKISESKLKIGDVETQAGMTAGYLSKLQKDDAKNNNILDFVVNISEILGISVDSLVHIDYSSLTKTERYFADFIDKLIRDTTEGDLCWDVETMQNLNDYSYQSNHPLFDVSEWNYETGMPEEYEYKSLFSIGATLASDGFKVFLNNATLYLMNILLSPDSFETAIEMYFVKENNQERKERNLIKICQIKKDTPLAKIANDLVMIAKESSKHIKLDSQTKSIIDDFMNEILF